MKKKYLYIILILAMVVALAGCGGINTPGQSEQADIPVKTDDADRMSQEESVISLERMDHSVRSDEGEILVVYFDKPIVAGDNDAAIKINAYFEGEYESWLTGTASRLSFYDPGRMQWFDDCVNRTRAALGDSQLATAQMKLEYTVSAGVIYEDQDVLSILQIVYISAGGPIRPSYFGSTFDLRTGELLPFTYFADVEADDFRSNLATYLIKNDARTFYSEEGLIDFIGPNSDHSFDFGLGEHRSDLSYEYFYDGTSIYLTENHIDNSSYIIEWNGKTGEQFSGTLLYLSKDVNSVFETFMKRNNRDE